LLAGRSGFGVLEKISEHKGRELLLIGASLLILCTSKVKGRQRKGVFFNSQNGGKCSVGGDSRPVTSEAHTKVKQTLLIFGPMKVQETGIVMLSV